MTTIPQTAIDEVWQRLNESSPEQARALAARMQREQPFLLVYLLAADENLLGDEDRGALLMLGATIWEIMSHHQPRLRQVTDGEIEAAEAANLRALEEMDEGSEVECQQAIQRLMSGYNQMPLLGAVLEALMAGHEETPELAPGHVGPALLHLKTVIDCLDQ